MRTNHTVKNSISMDTFINFRRLGHIKTLDIAKWAQSLPKKHHITPCSTWLHQSTREKFTHPNTTHHTRWHHTRWDPTPPINEMGLAHRSYTLFATPLIDIFYINLLKLKYNWFKWNCETDLNNFTRIRKGNGHFYWNH